MRKRPTPKSSPARSPKASHGNVVHLTLEHGPHKGIAKSEMLRRVHFMITALQLKKIELSIVLTNDAEIHELNKVYRHKDRPTDVLAFAMREGDFGELAEGVLGDVIVSVETARKQADERGVSALDEVTMLTAHGLLHLLGWDHDTPAKDRRMRAETDRLCLAAGAPDATTEGSPASQRAERAPVRMASKRGRTASKHGAKQALTRKLSRGNRPGKARKVEAHHEVMPRRSPKG